MALFDHPIPGAQRTPRELRLERVRMGGLARVKQGELLAWLGGCDNGVDAHRHNGDGDFVLGNELRREDYDELGPAARQWIGGGGDGDRVVSVIDTARGWGALTLKIQYRESRLWIPRDPTLLTPARVEPWLPFSARAPGEGLLLRLSTREGGFPNQTFDMLDRTGGDWPNCVAFWHAWTPPTSAFPWSWVDRDDAAGALCAALSAPVKEEG